MSVAQYVVTAVGIAAIAWVLWYFLPAAVPRPAEPATFDRHPSASPHTSHG